MSTRIAVTEQAPAAIIPGYSDAFAVEQASSDTRSALGWARAVFDDAPPLLLHRAATRN